MKNRKVAWLLTILMVVAAIALGGFKAPVKQSSSFYITDRADLFTAAEEAAILSDCQALVQMTDARMVIVTVKHTGLRSMEAYANLLCEEWKLTGADLLLVMKSDDYYFSIDYDWWPKIGENCETLLNRYLEPQFAVGNYGEAVLEFIRGTEAVQLSTNHIGPGGWGADNYESGSGALAVFLFFLVLMVVLCVIFSSKRPASKRSYYGGYANPGRPQTGPVIIHTTTHRPSSGPVHRPISSSRPASRPSSFSGGSRGGAGRSMGGSRGGGGRSGGSRGGGGRR